jgi:hypothetical protein
VCGGEREREQARRTQALTQNQHRHRYRHRQTHAQTLRHTHTHTNHYAHAATIKNKKSTNSVPNSDKQKKKHLAQPATILPEQASACFLVIPCYLCDFKHVINLPGFRVIHRYLCGFALELAPIRQCPSVFTI